MMHKFTLISALAGLASTVPFLSTSAQSAEALRIEGNHVILPYGVETEPHARVTFNKDRAARQGIVVETFLAGAAGSKLTISIDQTPIFTHVFTVSECSIENAKSHCSAAINSADVMSVRVRDGFRRGRVSRLQLETGGAMSMEIDAQLQGFSRAMRGSGG